MSLQFDCRACGTRHPSRLRIGKPHLLRMVMGAFGEVMEPCPLTSRWVKVRFDDLHWLQESAAPGEDRHLPAALPESRPRSVRPPTPLPT